MPIIRAGAVTSAFGFVDGEGRRGYYSSYERFWGPPPDRCAGHCFCSRYVRAITAA